MFNCLEGDLVISNLSDLIKFESRVVTLQGRFVGWQTANCQFLSQTLDKPITRGDWAIEINNLCAYVTGGMPEGLNIFNPANAGKLIEVEAEVKKNQDGKIYLQFRKGKILLKNK
jgi:hypothetical protein